MAVQPQDVKNITGSTVEDPVIQPFIDAANCLMERISEQMTSVSDECVDQATAYLASHLFTTSNAGKDSALLKREMLLNEYEVEYIVSKGGTGLLSTPYGETANMLTGGYLAQLDKTPPGFYTVGSIDGT